MRMRMRLTERERIEVPGRTIYSYCTRILLTSPATVSYVVEDMHAHSRIIIALQFQFQFQHAHKLIFYQALCSVVILWWKLSLSLSFAWSRLLRRLMYFEKHTSSLPMKREEYGWNTRTGNVKHALAPCRRSLLDLSHQWFSTTIFQMLTLLWFRPQYLKSMNSLRIL